MAELRKRPFLPALCAALSCAALAFAGPVQAQQSASGYEAERGGFVEEWVVISNHFRHSVNCTSDGCIVMGPMTDRAACEEWSESYNRFDPNDYTHCRPARDYNIRQR